MSGSNRTSYGDHPNYAANDAYSASETLLGELRDYLGRQQSPNDLRVIVEDALAALSQCRVSLQQGYAVQPKPDVLAAIDQAIDAIVLVNVRTNAVLDIGSEAPLEDIRRARATAEAEPRQ